MATDAFLMLGVRRWRHLDQLTHDARPHGVGVQRGLPVAVLLNMAATAIDSRQRGFPAAEFFGRLSLGGKRTRPVLFQKGSDRWVLARVGGGCGNSGGRRGSIALATAGQRKKKGREERSNSSPQPC